MSDEPGFGPEQYSTVEGHELPGFDAGYAQAIKDVAAMETQIADALVDSFEDIPEVQVGAYAIAEVVLALIESRFPATRNREEKGDG